MPANALRTIPPSWPFAIWGLNSVGPFRTTPGCYNHIKVAVDKFTNWIEVRAIACATSKEEAKIIEKIVHHFRIPNSIVTDLGSAFTQADFWDFCQDNLINVYYSSMVYPCCNGQVEHAKDTVFQAVKDRIFNDASLYSTRWLAKLPHVIWGLRTQVSLAIGYSPFFLVYRSEAILPTHLSFSTPLIQHYERSHDRRDTQGRPRPP
jgi:hypothetical protein